jgi:hypothetical protein
MTTRRKRRAASLDAAVDSIAANDDPAETDPAAIAQLISVALVADLWGRETAEIARKVIACRKRWAQEKDRDAA